jgi:hypothetical protein
MLHYTVAVNGAVQPVEVKASNVPAMPGRHRVSRKMCLALLAASIRRGERPTQRELANALGISVNLVSAAENLTGTERAALNEGRRPLILQSIPPRMLAPPVQPGQISELALAEIVRVAGVDRVLAAVEPFLS